MKKLPISLVAVSLLCSTSYAALAQTAAPPPAPPPLAPAPAPAVAAPAPADVPPPVVWTPPPPALLSPPPAPPPSDATPVELMSLKLMLQKGLISKAEFESALHDMQETTGQRTGSTESVVFGRWATTLYGFVEGDMILDTTRSLTEVPGGTLIARGGTSNGSNSRFTFGVRNTRFGIRMKAPEFSDIRTSAMLEADFLGNQPGLLNAGPYPGTGLPTSPYVSEGATFTNPTFRIRHANFKVETPVVDFMFGQYWQLFGWGSAYQPNSVEIQGLPGEIYARTPQLRISKTIKADPVTFEAAVAATRPVQRDSGMPDGQAGLRFSVDSWKGAQTTGSTGTQTAPLSIAVTGLLRRVEVNQLSTSSKQTNELTMSALAVDGFLPIVPGTKEKKDNSFSVQGEFATGYGYADMFSSTTFGMGFLTPPGATNTTSPATFYSPDIDPGIVAYDGLGHLHGIQLTSYLFGAQYYLPGVDGKLWISGNYSHQESANSHDYAAASGKIDRTATLLAQDWFDVNLFVDPVPGVRVGFEYANTRDTYVDGIFAVNHRGQMSGFFIF